MPCPMLQQKRRQKVQNHDTDHEFCKNKRLWLHFYRCFMYNINLLYEIITRKKDT